MTLEKMRRIIKKRPLLWTASCVAGLSVLALCLGRYWIPPWDVMGALFSWFLPAREIPSNAMNVVLSLRLPRVAAALMIGGALALSGSAYQAVFRNPLVAPDLLGVSSGACVGASLAILLEGGALAVQLSAFAGGLAAVAVTASIPKRLRREGPMVLLLGGIIVTGVLNSLIGLVKYLANPETHLVEITYWQLGSIAKVLPRDVRNTAVLMILSAGVLLSLRWRINVLSLGEAEARSLGLPVKKLRAGVILCATFLTACSVCIGGTVGWIGLVIPHLGRLLVGVDNLKLMPMAALLGAGFLLIVDTIARSLTGAELPLSILTGLLGASFFFWLLYRRKSSLREF